MGPTSGKRVRPDTPIRCQIEEELAAPMEGIGCTSWAICSDLALLGWTASDPCGSCVGTAITRLAGAAPDTARRAANRALLVTADELEGLLNRARRALPGGNTC
jgi:hypothetical protein